VKPGQGFAVRVTLDVLKKYQPFLSAPGARESRDAGGASRRDGAHTKADDEPFKGRALAASRPFKRAPRSRPFGAHKTSRRTGAIRLSRETVLLAEIPQGAGRWGQANFHKEDFVEFFGAHDPKRAFRLLSVRTDGTTDADPLRHGVPVKSKNFRIELAAARGSYPTHGKPIGAYSRLSTGQFRYMVLMPDAPEYGVADAILARHSETPRGQMRTARLTKVDAKREWPGSPLWK
jgi:hypothetical protein